jgi:hypothetical protein
MKCKINEKTAGVRGGAWVKVELPLRELKSNATVPYFKKLCNLSSSSKNNLSISLSGYLGVPAIKDY